MSAQPRVPYPGLYKNASSEGKGHSEEVVYLEAGAPYPLGWTEQPADEWVLLEKQDVMVRDLTEPLAYLPADTNVGIKVLRRYMDYWKYKDLVRRGAIYMSTAEQLHDSDAMEGLHVRYLVPHDMVGDRLYRTLHAFTTDSLTRFLISCWCESPDESEHMWEQYTQSSDSVVLVTTPHRISRGLRYPRYVRLHRMQYTDEPFSVDCSPGGSDIHATILHKRTEYQHEQEVRLIAEKETRVLPAVRDTATGEQIEGWQPGDDGPPHLLHIMPSVISEVRTHPAADDALVDRIEYLHRSFGMYNIRVSKSELSSDEDSE